MTQCEQKKLFMVDGKKKWKWARVDVAKIGSKYEAIRCVHCHGAVRIHKQKVDHGAKDHVEHLSHQDSMYCVGGHYYEGGDTRMSLQPIV